MSPHPPTTFRLEPGLMEGLQAIRERDGVPIAEQVRRAIRMWLDAEGIKVKKAERKRAVTRKRP